MTTYPREQVLLSALDGYITNQTPQWLYAVVASTLWSSNPSLWPLLDDLLLAIEATVLAHKPANDGERNTCDAITNKINEYKQVLSIAFGMPPAKQPEHTHLRKRSTIPRDVQDNQNNNKRSRN